MGRLLSAPIYLNARTASLVCLMHARLFDIGDSASDATLIMDFAINQDILEIGAPKMMSRTSLSVRACCYALAERIQNRV